MKFKPDSHFYKFTSTLFQFIALNLIYIISCIPIVTIGVATTSMMSVTMKYTLDEDEYFIKNYYNAWKENWMLGSGVFLFLSIIILILLFSGFFWFNVNSMPGTILGLLSTLFAIYTLLACIFSFALVARFDNSLGRSIKLALTLPLVNLVKSLAVLLIIITTICSLILFPFFKILFMFIGFSFISYCVSIFILSVFKQLENN